MPPVYEERMRRMFSPSCDLPDEPQCAPAWRPAGAIPKDDKPKETDLNKVFALVLNFKGHWASTFKDARQGKSEVKEDVEARRLFERFYAEWDRDTANVSNVTKVITHRAYYRIIALGKRALPFILESLAGGHGPWFVALDAIVGDDSEILPEHRNNARQLREDWLAWGRKNGYLESQASYAPVISRTT